MAISRKDFFVALFNLVLGFTGLLLVCGGAGAAEKASPPPNKAVTSKPTHSGALTPEQIGYRDCSLKKLAACQNSNQLFFSSPKGTPSPRKTDFEDALEKFLLGAPYQRVAQYKFSAYSVARQSLIGASGKPVRLSGGELFMDGFNTYYDPDRAAVIFDAAGHIVLAATLGSQTDAALPHMMRLSQRVLTIYVRETPHKAALIAYAQDWAHRALVDNAAKYSGAAKDTLAETDIFSSGDNASSWASEQRRS